MKIIDNIKRFFKNRRILKNLKNHLAYIERGRDNYVLYMLKNDAIDSIVLDEKIKDRFNDDGTILFLKSGDILKSDVSTISIDSFLKICDSEFNEISLIQIHQIEFITFVEQFLTDLIENVDVHVYKVEQINDIKHLYFTYNSKYYLIQYSKDKIDWMLKSNNETFNYNIECKWSDESTYLGVKDNSILPKNFNIKNTTVLEFLNQINSITG